MKRNNIISDWLNEYGDPEVDKFVENQLNQNKMEQTPVEFIKEQIELDGDTDFLHINWDKFYDIIEQAYMMDIKRLESLKDFDTWKEWKNSK